MNTGVHVPFLIILFSRYMPRSGVEESCGNYYQCFKEPPYCSPQWLVPIYIPTNIVGGFIFSTPFLAFIICRLFGDGHSDWSEVILHCNFDLYFSNHQVSFSIDGAGSIGSPYERKLIMILTSHQTKQPFPMDCISKHEK